MVRFESLHILFYRLNNYYNHNTSNGAFVAQTLGYYTSSSDGHKYVKIVGNTVGYPKNASTMLSFKNIINNYENTVQASMQGASFWEVANWVFTLAGFVFLASGFSTGPVGWAAIYSAKTITEMVVLLGSFTSSTYTTVA
ncbi:hypothetical protein ABEX19_25215, partial [Paenibacillus naphthalenovorans]